MAKEKVKPKDTVTVYATGRSKFLPKGKEVKLHKIAAKNLIDKGFATKTKAEAEKSGKAAEKDPGKGDK